MIHSLSLNKDLHVALIGLRVVGIITELITKVKRIASLTTAYVEIVHRTRNGWLLFKKKKKRPSGMA